MERYATSDLVDDALEQIADTPEPWFGYLAFNAGHIPAHVPPDDLNVTGVTDNDPKWAQLDAVVGALDLEIGRLLETMPADCGRGPRFVVLGDNGSERALTTAPFDPDHAKGTMFQRGSGSR